MRVFATAVVFVLVGNVFAATVVTTGKGKKQTTTSEASYFMLTPELP